MKNNVITITDSKGEKIGELKYSDEEYERLVSMALQEFIVKAIESHLDRHEK